jgi:hypothetical protein
MDGVLHSKVNAAMVAYFAELISYLYKMLTILSH